MPPAITLYGVRSARLFGLALLAASCGDGGTALTAVPACGTPVPFTAAEVEAILAQAVARALADGVTGTATVVNRDGVVVGQFRMAGAAVGFEDPSKTKARTAALLSSGGHAFSTRTARFILQDHFPPDLPNTPGGPLYGVQFSSLPCSDVVGETSGTVLTLGSGLSGEPGSVPLYRDGCLIGGVGFDGAPAEEAEERAAWAGSLGFRPAPSIFGSEILIDGIRFEFLEEMPPDLAVVPPFGSLAGTVVVAPVAAPPDAPFPPGLFGGVVCEVRYPVIASPSVAATKLLAADVTAILDAAAARAERTRAAIRRPLGAAAQVHVAVVDADGVVLGCIRTPDGTLFSFDVAVQKARTALLFSSGAAAITTRAAGFLAQRFYPPGIDSGPEGPLHGLQDVLNPSCSVPGLPLGNGITVFPGGIPVYKGGTLVGAVGVSGDGVDQDDYIGAAGAELFPPPPGARGDELDEAAAVAHLRAVVAAIAAASPDPAVDAACSASDARFAAQGLMGLRLPYVKFPRQPER